jgi:putative hydrolase
MSSFLTLKFWGEKLRSASMDLHVHSNFSHGQGSIQEIANVAILKKLDYVAITEHVRLQSPWFDSFLSEIETVKKKTAVKLLSGIESKVLDFSGTLDATDKMIKSVDLVVASVHRLPSIHDMGGELTAEKLNMDDAQVVDCYLRALSGIASNPTVDIVGHPFHLLKALGIKKLDKDSKVKLAELFSVSNKIVEINSSYKVPDLEFVKICLKERVKFSIGSDAHRLKEVGNVAWSKRLLEKAGGTSKDIIDVDHVLLTKNGGK